MKRRALRRLRHKLEFLHNYLTGVEPYDHGHIEYNWENKPTTPTKLMQRAIKQLDNAIKK